MTALYNAMYNAAEMGDLERVMLLADQGADKNQISGSHGATALCRAAAKRHFDVARYLVEQGADMEKADRNGDTPLIYASYNGHVDVVRYLLDHGADRDKANEFDCTPIHAAAEGGHLETAKLLMVYGADLNAQDYYGRSPINVALTEEMRQAIRDEPRRRMDHGHKRATEQDLTCCNKKRGKFIAYSVSCH